MRISLLTDAPKHNLALMKLSAWHKASGDQVLLNSEVFPADYRYASILFKKNEKFFNADEYGGPAFLDKKLSDEVEGMKPDYDLYKTDFSLGYTFRPCFNSCWFCKVPLMNHPDVKHHSIWEFHDSRFKKICILNNNTFQDPQWKETFEEIWDAKLTVIDENGYDLRLLDDEKCAALKKTRFQGKLHFAWDRIQDEPLIVEGMKTLLKHGIKESSIYILVGYDTTKEMDLHRFQTVVDHRQNPYIMPYVRDVYGKAFKRFSDSFMWRKFETIKEAWGIYKAHEGLAWL